LVKILSPSILIQKTEVKTKRRVRINWQIPITLCTNFKIKAQTYTWVPITISKIYSKC